MKSNTFNTSNSIIRTDQYLLNLFIYLLSAGVLTLTDMYKVRLNHITFGGERTPLIVSGNL